MAGPKSPWDSVVPVPGGRAALPLQQPAPAARVSRLRLAGHALPAVSVCRRDPALLSWRSLPVRSAPGPPDRLWSLGPRSGRSGAGTGQGNQPAAERAASRAHVTIDPGHGGVDPGNPGVFFPRGTREKDVTLAVGLLLRDELKRQGVGVQMTRTSDTLIALGDRGSFCTEACDLFVSIHVNSLARRRGTPTSEASRPTSSPRPRPRMPRVSPRWRTRRFASRPARLPPSTGVRTRLHPQRPAAERAPARVRPGAELVQRTLKRFTPARAGASSRPASWCSPPPAGPRSWSSSGTAPTPRMASS